MIYGLLNIYTTKQMNDDKRNKNIQFKVAHTMWKPVIARTENLINLLKNRNDFKVSRTIVNIDIETQRVELTCWEQRRTVAPVLVKSTFNVEFLFIWIIFESIFI